MRKVAFGLLVLTALLLGACASREPQIALDPPSFDFGRVVSGEVVAREVTVRNLGDAPLVVEAVTTSCGCTKATLDPMVIPPGERGVLQITFDSGVHGSDMTGEVVRQVFIASNDPGQPEVVLEFTAEVVLEGAP